MLKLVEERGNERVPCKVCCKKDVRVLLEWLQVASRDLLGKMSAKAQPCRCIRHLINLLIH